MKVKQGGHDLQEDTRMKVKQGEVMTFRRTHI